MDAHWVERAATVDRTHIERAWRGRKFACSQADDFGSRRNPPQVPCRVGVVGRSPTATEIDLVIGTAHAHEVSGRCEVGAWSRWFPSADGESVETQNDEGRECENAEEDPGGHLGEVRRERPRRECRSLPDCPKADQRSGRERAGWSSRLHVHEQQRGAFLLCRDPNREARTQRRASFRR